MAFHVQDCAGVKQVSVQTAADQPQAEAHGRLVHWSRLPWWLWLVRLVLAMRDGERLTR